MRRLLVLLATLLLCATPATAATRSAAPLGGGSHLYSVAGTRGCTAGFAALGSSGSWYLIANQGCGSTGTTVYSGNGVLVGTITAGQTTSGAAVVLVTNHTDWTLVGWVGGGVTLTGSTQAPVGASVCLIGTATGYHCGTIQARNVTVSFPTGVLTGLTRTNVCVEPGDTAVSFVSGSQAQGVLVGGSGNCTSGGTSFFAPLNPIFAQYGLTLKV
ncbi:S1 family peptidase [Labedaea rhizosphaerae]|uniref:Streptogrisin C n=1 Tax=Labedaea rhizosphaerae TaxID=598644 RepID=A0A4R6SFT2_LABRH|nr:S1 family peptidase [Labedaea rhizosphaerae]TDP98055.1 streptogrisin C [Labedaea rhizosphaerae]